VSASFGVDHDTRDYIIDPWRAVGLGAGVAYALTMLENGERLSQVTAGAEALAAVSSSCRVTCSPSTLRRPPPSAPCACAAR